MGRYFGTIDGITTLLLFAIGCFGLFILLTIDQTLFIQQLFFLIIGFILFLFVANMDPAVLWWSAPFCYIASLFLVSISYLGPTIRGASRWIMIAGGQLQPSEFVKPLLLLSFSWFIVRYPPRNIKYVPLHIILFLVPFLLVFKQPDLGSSLVYAGFWLSMMVAGGLSLLLLIVCIAGGPFLLPILWGLLREYQQARILTFLNPALDPKGAGYNALQSMIAVGSGKLFGRGLGRGTQSHLRFLPEYHTDFIFATLVEELGFIGGLLLLSAYFLLLSRIILPFLRGINQHDGVFVYSFGLLAMVMVQIVVNTGMNMGLIPITGITLPFVSYGGSSILSVAVSFGMLMSLRRMARGNAPIAF